LILFVIGVRHDGEHQVEQVESSKENHEGKEHYMERPLSVKYLLNQS
jgi:hypothetical protein